MKEYYDEGRHSASMLLGHAGQRGSFYAPPGDAWPRIPLSAHFITPLYGQSVIGRAMPAITEWHAMPPMIIL